MKTISDHILDILQNSVRAGATLIEIMVREEKSNDLYAVRIKDDGHGMTREKIQQATQPFFTTRTTRKVGLGLPLLKQNAEMCGGSLTIDSEPGKGTSVTAVFGYNHVDRPPMGDITGVLVLTIIGHDGIRFIYSHKTDEGEFELDTDSLHEIFEDVPLRHPEVRGAISELIKGNLTAIGAST
jgi:hypothetical protein